MRPVLFKNARTAEIFFEKTDVIKILKKCITNVKFLDESNILQIAILQNIRLITAVRTTFKLELSEFPEQDVQSKLKASEVPSLACGREDRC